MDRTTRIPGRAVGLALAGALLALSCRASSPAAVTEPSSGAHASATPRVVASAGPTVKVARADKPPPKAVSIVLPTVWIYGHAPRTAYTLPALSPTTAALDRFYGSSAEHFDLGGLRLWTPEAQPPALLPPPAIGPGILSAPKLAMAPQAPPALPLRFDGDPKLPEPVTADVLRSHRGAFDVCYATAAHVRPGIQGRADVDFLVGKDGHVDHVETQGEGLAGSSVPSCVSNVVSKLMFAPPSGPVEVHAHFKTPSSGA